VTAPATHPGQAAGEPLEYTVARGADASALLADQNFHAEWDAVVESCPWATVFQARPFVALWFSVYEADYEPVVFMARSVNGALQAAGFLALHRATGALTFAGAHHAEYHTLLSVSADFGSVVQGLAAALRKVVASGVLHFHFLAPGTPTGWLSGAAGKGVFRLHQAHSRAIVDLARPEALEQSLRKSSNKSKLRRLEALGRVELRRLISAAEASPYLEDIVAYCDLRQGALNQTTPFRSDPRKLPFYLRLLDQPELQHATVLLVGGQLAAFHLGPIDRRRVSLGLIGHSPMLAPHSPGKLLLLLLCQQLAREGFSEFDLTPGGGYKERFATSTEPAYAVQLYFDRRAYIASRLRLGLRRGAARVARAAGVSPDLVRRAGQRAVQVIRRGLTLRGVRTLVRRAGEAAWSTKEFQVFACFNLVLPDTRVPEWRVRRLHLVDLLMYEPESGREADYFRFLSEALERLERGRICFTHSEEGRLTHHSWLEPDARQRVTSIGGPAIRFSAVAGVLWDAYTHPSARGRGLHKESIVARLQELQRIASGRVAVTEINSKNHVSKRNYERHGFVPIATARRARLLGFIVRRITYTAAARAIVDPAGPGTGV
jgi:CelD/BcsL family acetyltransferase involved in cellulose biosynthesis/RimJ/RimL family protein N-acetyltransferase